MAGLVAAPKVERALRFLNHHLGSADLALDLEPEGLGVAFARASATAVGSNGGAEGGSGDGDGTAVVKLGGGRRCHCSLFDCHTRRCHFLLLASRRRGTRRRCGCAALSLGGST